MLKLKSALAATIGMVAFGANLVVSSKAIGDPITAQLDCGAPSSEVEAKECANRADEQADRRLNQVYQRLASKLNNGERQEGVNLA